MRTKEEIQAAHDMILPVLLGEIPNPLGQKETDCFHIAADVLCWVLEHDHNPAFAANLSRLRNQLNALGLELHDHGN